MSAKKEFIYWMEAKEKDGSITRYRIYKKGRNFFINEHLMHPSAKSIEDEIRIVFKAEVLRTIMPGQE